MAKNREHEMPVESESESGEEASSEEVGSDESDSEPQTQLANKALSSSKPQQQQQPSSSSDEEESGSESESESDGPQTNVKPIASKPMDDPVKKPRSKPKVTTPTKSAVSKRPEEEKQTEAKKSKKAEAVESSEKKPTNDDPKKLLFQRLWSEGDEIEILKGLMDYIAKKKTDPLADLSAFHDYIREKLHVDVSTVQLQHKIRRLKKKFSNNRSKAKEGRKNRNFSNPHELKAYELSEMIWGNESEEMESPKAKTNGGSVKKGTVKRGRANVSDEAGEAKGCKKVKIEREERYLQVPTTIEHRIIKLGAELYESGKGLEGEKEWKRLKLEEVEVQLRQLDVKRAQTRLVLNALKGNSSQ